MGWEVLHAASVVLPLLWVHSSKVGWMRAFQVQGGLLFPYFLDKGKKHEHSLPCAWVGCYSLLCSALQRKFVGAGPHGGPILKSDTLNLFSCNLFSVFLALARSRSRGHRRWCFDDPVRVQSHREPSLMVSPGWRGRAGLGQTDVSQSDTISQQSNGHGFQPLQNLAS
jgi:hypothetical protein